MSDSAKCRIIMKHGHCTMQMKCKGKHSGCCVLRGQTMSLSRAGMRRARDEGESTDMIDVHRADGEHLVVCINPPHLVSDAINVYTDAGLAEKVKSAILKVAKLCLVGDLKLTLAGMCEVDHETVRIYPPGDEFYVIPDWAQPQHVMIMRGGQPLPHVIQRGRGDDGHSHTLVSLEWAHNGQRFYMDAPRGANHLGFLKEVSKVVGHPTAALITTDRRRRPWIYPYDMIFTQDVLLEYVRAGMRTQASVTRGNR